MSSALTWLKDNKQFLKIKAIETHLGIGDSVLVKAVDGVRPLPDRYEKSLENWVKNFIQLPVAPRIEPVKTTKKETCMEAAKRISQNPSFKPATTKQSVLPPKPEKRKGENAIDYSQRVNEWKKKCSNFTIG